MAKSYKNKLELPPETIVEVVAIRSGRIRIKEMKLQEAQALKKTKGWVTLIYQKGFHSFKKTE